MHLSENIDDNTPLLFAKLLSLTATIFRVNMILTAHFVKSQ